LQKGLADINNNVTVECEVDAEVNNCTDSDSVDPLSKMPRLTRNASKSSAADDMSVCFFCGLPGADLRQVMTFAVDERVRQCATLTNDTLMLGKLAQGDMIAMESKYHPACILSFYRKAAAVQTEINVEMDDAVSPHVNAESLALAEVIAYMEDMRLVEVTPTVFKLSELCQLYCNHLEKLDVPVTSKVHASRIKERILDNYPAVTAVPHGRDVLLTFGEHVGAALQQMRENEDADAVHLMHAAKLAVRNEIFSFSSKFTGSLSNHKTSVPSSLVSFISMILEGPGYENYCDSEAALSISQLLMFNAIKRRRRQMTVDESVSTVVRHVANRETPLPIYVGLMLHSSTRQKN
jgi:hypothetical protein